jgi:glutamate--cysteine ligase
VRPDPARATCAPAAGSPSKAQLTAAGGTSDPRYAQAASTMMTCALAALEDRDPAARVLVAEYAERWTWRGRCPADDRLEAWQRGAPLLDPDADLLGAG